MQYIIGPGVLPVVMALSKDILGKRLLVTRRVAARMGIRAWRLIWSGIGVRIMLYFDEASRETVVEWGCLYGVLCKLVGHLFSIPAAWLKRHKNSRPQISTVGKGSLLRQRAAKPRRKPTTNLALVEFARS